MDEEKEYQKFKKNFIEFLQNFEKFRDVEGCEMEIKYEGGNRVIFYVKRSDGSVFYENKHILEYSGLCFITNIKDIGDLYRQNPELCEDFIYDIRIYCNYFGYHHCTDTWRRFTRRYLREEGKLNSKTF